jgi:hypothetical protein
MKGKLYKGTPKEENDDMQGADHPVVVMKPL